MSEFFEKDFAIFDREQFAFQQIKAELTDHEVEEIKTAFKTVWQKWKMIQLNVYTQLDQNYYAKPKIESWTNGWNLRSHFWSAYRGINRQNENACIGVLLNKKQLQIYLMYQHYKSADRSGTVGAYNQLLESLPEWSEPIDLTDYYIWPQQEHELMDHLPLQKYLQNPSLQHEFRNQLADRTFQLGKLYFREAEIAQVEEKILQAFEELAVLYRMLED